MKKIYGYWITTDDAEERLIISRGEITEKDKQLFNQAIEEGWDISLVKIKVLEETQINVAKHLR